jgi:hypothetical protein
MRKISVQEQVCTQAYVEAVVAMERWPDYGALADSGEAFHQ